MCSETVGTKVAATDDVQKQPLRNDNSLVKALKREKTVSAQFICVILFTINIGVMVSVYSICISILSSGDRWLC